MALLTIDELSKIKPIPGNHICQYCGKRFVREQTLMAHVCEKQRRMLAKDNLHVKMGYEAFVRFYKKQLGHLKFKTYEDFCDSQYYNAFVKFGSFVINARPLYPDNFVDYVIKSGVKLDDWCSDLLYDKYVVELIRTESSDTAMQRTFETMLSWGDANKKEWNLYFSEVNVNRAFYDIKDGKISPWVFLNSAKGKQLVSKLQDEQLSMLSGVLDIRFWLIKFKRYPADVEVIKHVIREAGI